MAYLFDGLEEDERVLVEDAYFASSNLFECLQALEDEATLDYIYDRIPRAKKQNYKRQLDCDAVLRSKVREAMVLRLIAGFTATPPYAGK